MSGRPALQEALRTQQRIQADSTSYFLVSHDLELSTDACLRERLEVVKVSLV